MESSYTRPRLSPSRQMILRAVMRTVFTLIVLGAVPIILLFLFQEEAGVRFNGIVDSGFENVGPVDASRIVSIDVGPGDEVKAGDVLVRFDSAASILDEQMKNLKIRELELRLHSRLDDLIDRERRSRQALVSAKEKYLSLEMDRIHDEAELASNLEELERLDTLITKKLISEKDLIKIRPQVLSLQKVVSQYPAQLEAYSNSVALLSADLDSAVAERESGEKEVAEGLVAVREAFEKSEEIRRADPGVVRALHDGKVSRVFRRPGDIVTAGDAVLRLQSDDENVYVTGMLPLGMQDAVKVGDTLWVTRLVYATGRTSPSIEAEVVAIDAEVMDLFSPTESRPSAPVRGRKVRIRVKSDLDEFVPGEGVTITDQPLDRLLTLFNRNKKGSRK